MKLISLHSNTLIACAASIAFPTVSALGAQINAFNFALSPSASIGFVLDPIATSDGNAVPAMTGFISIAALTLQDSEISQVNQSITAYQNLLSDFESNKFGESGIFGDAAAFGTDGLYNFAAQAFIEQGSPLAGRSIYTVLGNGETFSSSSEIAVFRHSVNFEEDLPLFLAEAATVTDDNGIWLLGTPDSAPVLIEGAGLFASTQLATVVPEPSIGLLAAIGIGALGALRRR